jgi:hypothetical protein
LGPQAIEAGKQRRLPARHGTYIVKRVGAFLHRSLNRLQREQAEDRDSAPDAESSQTFLFHGGHL